MARVLSMPPPPPAPGARGGHHGERSLDAAMRAPSTISPDVIVLDFVEEDVKAKEVANPKKDLWLSSVDGRHQSPIIPIRVGPNAELFQVHRDILTKSEYFRKALYGEFREAEDQAIDLPEEDPAIFSFVVAFLYEEKYVPIKPIATVLVAEPDKGKGREKSDEPGGSSDDGTDGVSGSDDRYIFPAILEKCTVNIPVPGVAEEETTGRDARTEPGSKDKERSPGGIDPIAIVQRALSSLLDLLAGIVAEHEDHHHPEIGHNPHQARRRPSRNNIALVEPAQEDRMSIEDLRTWCLAYSLSVDVYVCAERYLMQDFKSCISACIINNFEIAGLDAAQPSVLASCKTLLAGVSTMDPLLKKVFARVGFLQARLWKKFPEETSAFFMENPELATLIMKEMAERREEEKKDDLPAMERAIPLSPGPREYVVAVYILLLSLTLLTEGQELLASLDYGKFQGAYSSTYNITYFRKIPFAAPPIGKNRFRAPQPPLRITNGTYDSNQAYDMCVQRTANGTEDCLYLGLYSRPWQTTQRLRPVLVNFFGGAFIEGGGSFTLPPGEYPVLNVSTSNDFITVLPNYRVNAFGFLPGAEISADPNSDLNPGLLDQQAVLKWVHKYISSFGGDPRNVTIWGQSAGAGSVVAQVIANGGMTTPPLFSKALASSPFWPKTYKFDAPEAQAIYNTLASLTGCAGADSLACLKTVDVQAIRDASLQISSSHTYNTSSYTWAPVIDGRFLTQTLSQASLKGETNIDFGFGMYNTHEGENFIPAGLDSVTSVGSPPFNSSTSSFMTYIHGFLPRFSERDIQAVLQMYPSPGSSEEIISYNTTYEQAQLIYRDLILACPTYWMAGAAKKKGYVGEYTISPATHAADTGYWSTVNSLQITSPIIYAGFTGAFASFIQTGDPNTHKLTGGGQSSVPEIWSMGREFVIEAQGLSLMDLNNPFPSANKANTNLPEATWVIKDRPRTQHNTPNHPEATWVTKDRPRIRPTTRDPNTREYGHDSSAVQ
ncbi:hypothetical protein B7494_g1182 [Chlorociboria aeruginascens]|nr:hypothetical protein B7494_g1182 [Chlorociboria aeruginascens]